MLVFKEIVEYSPDLILLLMGNNISKEFLEMNQHLLNEYTRYFYENYWVCRKIFNLTRNKLKNNPKNIGGIYVFRVNYNEILEISKAKNIPLILFTVPANMKDYPPSSPSIPIDDKDFIIARLEMEENKYNSAIEIFTKLIKTEEYKANPYVYFYAAKCFENMSKYKKAKEMYYEAIDLDYGVRRHSRINEIIREIGRQKSYMFVDIEKIFTEFSENGLLGFDFFSDPCHWRSAYDELIIPEILKEVSRFSGKGPILNLNTDGFNREINRKAISEEASRAILYECNEGFYGVFNVFLSAEEGVPLKEAFVSKLRYIYPKCNKKLQAQVGLKDNIIEYLKLNIWQNNTEALNKNWNVVLWNIGEAFRQMKDYAPALEYFNASINTKSDDINAYYFRGMTYYMLKDYQKARNDWNIVINKDAKYSWLNDLVPLNDNKNIK
ncbi:MAG: tetratricopeptide repeat protein [Elusimicrobia bacterium]|nr:tetratricopeptide repeat protein [Candidatus Liberimonas magnetica]